VIIAVAPGDAGLGPNPAIAMRKARGDWLSVLGLPGRRAKPMTDHRKPMTSRRIRPSPFARRTGLPILD
jgi:hypothetical protein